MSGKNVSLADKNINVNSKNVKKTRKSNLVYLHAAIVIFFMFIFGIICPQIGCITPLGMKILGIFIGMLYGWTTCGMIWPSLLGMVAFAGTGMMPMTEFLKVSFGNESVVFILFMFVFTAVIDEVGLINFIANWFISRKIVAGRPWVFSFILLLGCFVASQINMFVAILVFWGIIYIVADKFGFERYDGWTTFMVMGVVVASAIGGCVLPYKLVPLAMLGVYRTVTGGDINFFQYVCFALPITLLIMVIFVLVGRLIIRPDVKGLKNLSVDFVKKEDLILNTKQKTALAYLIVFIVLMLAPGALPKTWAIRQFLDQIGIVGVVMLMIVLMFWTYFDGKPLMDFKKMAAQGVGWDIFIIFAMVIPFASIFTNDATGIKQYMLAVLKPLLAGHSPMIFIFLVMLLAVILTNFANNMVVGAALIPVIYAIGSAMGVNVMAAVAVLIIVINLAFVTPAASPGAAMVFANEWVRAKDIYKMALPFVIVAFLVVSVVGIFWANIIY